MAQQAEFYHVYSFKLIIPSLEAEAHFTECSGIGAKIQAVKYRENGNNLHVLPGFVEYTDVVLKYGLTKSRGLWDWFMAIADGNVKRLNVSIVVTDRAGTTEAMRWNLHNAWPSEWQGTVLNSTQQEVALESLTLVYEKLERA